MRPEAAILREKLVLLTRVSEAARTGDAASGDKIDLLRDIALSLLEEIDSLRTTAVPDVERGIDLFDEVRRFETELIRRALRLSHGSQTRAARLLGVNPTTLNYKIKRYNIAPFETRGFPVAVESLTPVEDQPFDASVTARA
jgi:transcriptional regulator with GAF, ATPase, and Fis domain